MTAPTTPGQSRVRRHRFLRRLVTNRSALVAAAFVGLLIVIALLGRRLTPFDPNAQDLRNALADPFTSGHHLGTDELGRDTLSRLLVATRVAMMAAGQATLVALVLGVPPGLVAGYFGGLVDAIVMRLTDAVQSFVPLLLAIALVGILGPGLGNAMLAVGIVFAPTFLRITRSAVLEVRAETYVEASIAMGTPTVRILTRRILPNVLPPLLVQTSLTLSFSLLAEAGLSFLGLGVQPPEASWGSMLGKGYAHLASQPWLMCFPGVLIGATVLSFNVIGDALRDAMGREVGRAG